ncbi:MAG: hypothetical protein H6937_02010 [Burkholderiales bacterium]|nr:hypothetical protein [Burkholderiales bacterium]MDR4517930.1 hypothetical protein [Nitrosomonas sp.]
MFQNVNYDEAYVVLPFVQSGIRLKGDMTSYLQEGNLKTEIKRMRNIEVMPIHVDILMCRAIEYYFTYGHNKSIIQMLENVVGRDAINSFFARNCDHEMGRLLKNSAIYRNEDYWNQLICNSDLPKIAYNTLFDYYQLWVNGDAIDGHDRIFSQEDVSGPDLETDNNAAANSEQFYAMFPAASFALLYLTKHCGGAEIISKIALEHPCNSFDSAGNGLWLRRRALVSCANVWGPQFIIDHLDDLTDCLLDYVILKANLRVYDLRRIKMAILGFQEEDEDDELYNDQPSFSS